MEANVGSLFSEGLSADVQAVLSDDSVSGTGDSAIKMLVNADFVKLSIISHTKHGSPFRIFLGGRTKRFREPY